jgi:hypothetical protein
MRVRRIVLVAVASCSTVLSPAIAGPAASAAASFARSTLSTGVVVAAAARSASDDAAYVDRALHRISIGAFEALVLGPHDPWFDWTTDWCSAPMVGSTGRSFDFRWPCRRHDFGYRNLKRLDRVHGPAGTWWNATTKLAVDRRFLTDMHLHCGARPWWDESPCRAWATTFYGAVRAFG